jgi:GntR family transcriptional regulator, rspAB operon transcriptional repressor
MSAMNLPSSGNRLKPIRPADVTGMVRQAIEDAIIEGELPPGNVLVDRQLAATFNVSRTPVRDALRALEPTGLIRRTERGTQIGWVVAEFRERDIHELFQLRRVLEPLAFVEPPAKDLDADLLRLAAFFDDFPADLTQDDYSAYIARDRDFHMELVKLSGNSRAISYYQILEKQIDRIRHFLAIGYEGRMTQIVVEHTAIYDAMRQGDLSLIATNLREHLKQGEESMILFARDRGLLVPDAKE